MIRIVKYVLIISVGVSMVFGLFFRPEHPHFWWEKIPIFDAVFGFLGCILIILGSKALGHHWLQKDEDYYRD
jgi:predicted membrane protein